MIKRRPILFSLLIFLVALNSCNYDNTTSNHEEEENIIIELTKDTLIFGSPINFGNIKVGIDQSIEIDINDFKTYKQLTDRIEELICNDSLPFFKIESDSTYKILYTINPCWDLYACILIYQRNVMTIRNDSVFTHFESTKKLDSLPSQIKAQIENFGKSEYYADNFKKLIFTVVQDSLDKESFIKTLDYLSAAYYEITERTDMHLRVDRLIEPLEPQDLITDSINIENTP